MEGRLRDNTVWSACGKRGLVGHHSKVFWRQAVKPIQTQSIKCILIFPSPKRSTYPTSHLSRWETANGTRCERGYLVIMETESENIKMLCQRTENQGEMNYALYQSAFGEQCVEENLDAEGFFVIKWCL